MYQLPSTKSTENLIRLANKRSVPRDQLERFLKSAYIPLPWALSFHAACREADGENGPTDIACGGARGPGKSHAVFAQMAIDDCQRVSGLKGLFLRQTAKSAEESFQDLIDNIIARKLEFQYSPSRGVLKFKNGSKIILGGFENEKDIDKYIGIQYDVMGLEERNQLTGDKVIKLKGSLRTTKTNWRARMYSSFNPGNIGHADVKKTFVEPYKAKTEGRTRFFPSTYKDNPFLKEEYVEYLNSLQGALGKAWRDGNFDTFEGQYFIEWDYNRHTIAPFTIPPTWKRFRSYDYGYENPAACAWYALDYDGRVWVYREKYWPKGHKTTAEDQAKEIHRLSEGEVYEYSVADPAIFSPTGMVDKSGGQTIAESFARNGIIWYRGSNRRVDGWNLVHQYLYWNDQTIPKMIFFNTCKDSIRTYPLLIHDEHKPEDLDTDGEDHAQDRDRLFLVSLHERKTPVPLNETQKKLKQMQNGQTNLNSLYYG